MTQLETFISLTEDIPYQPKSIFPSEMFLFYSCALAYKVDQVVETGIGFGGSTRYLARLFDNVISIDKGASKMNFKGVKLVSGDAMKKLPQVVNSSKSKSIAILIDGPKGKKAINLLRGICKHPKVVLVAVHDLAFEKKKFTIDSHSKDFRKAFSFLDEKCGSALLKHPNGPGLSLFT